MHFLEVINCAYFPFLREKTKLQLSAGLSHLQLTLLILVLLLVFG